jgi:hypothetical protein
MGAVTKMRKAQEATTTSLASTWLPWTCVLQEGHYCVEEDLLPEVHKYFLWHGRSVQVPMTAAAREP